MDNNYWRENLRKLITSSGLTQKELEQKSGVSQSHLSLLINGKRPFTQKIIEPILTALNKTYHDMFFIDDSKTIKNNVYLLPVKNNNNHLLPKEDTHIQAMYRNLEIIIKSGDEETIEAIKSNLLVFRKTVELSQQNKEMMDRIRKLESKGG